MRVFCLCVGIEKGSVILEVTANDRDLNPSLNYEFAPGGNPHEAFSVDRYSGKITVARALDHEAVAVYNLLVLVGGNTRDWGGGGVHQGRVLPRATL